MGDRKPKNKRITDKNIRVALEFSEFIKEVKLARIKNGKDTFENPKSTRRITLGITRHDLFPTIKQALIEKDLKDDFDLK